MKGTIELGKSVQLIIYHSIHILYAAIFVTINTLHYYKLY